MHNISRREASTAIRILAESFKTNPSALWVIKQDEKVLQRLQALVSYAVRIGISQGGVYLSNDKSTAAICFQEPAKFKLSSYWYQLVLIIKAIGFSRVPQVLEREHYLKKHRPSVPYLNFWFLGADPNRKGSKGAFGIKQAIFELADARQLPIILETSVARNKLIYERYGFYVYHTWQKSNNYTLWFMRRDPASMN